MSKEFKYDENDPRSYEDQYAAWVLCADTLIYDITTYPGSREEQSTTPTYPPKVVTKKGRL